MKKAKITTDISKSIEALILTNEFTYQDILNHFNNKFTINQLKYHVNKNYSSIKSFIKKEYSRGGSKLEYLLKQIFPADKIHPEYHVGNKLRLDFYIENPYNLGFEFDGIQHENYTGLYNSYTDFTKAQDRDLEKEEICKEYGINLIRFSKIENLDIEAIQLRVKERGYGIGLQADTKVHTSDHLQRHEERQLLKEQQLRKAKTLRAEKYQQAKRLKEQLKSSEQKTYHSSFSPSDEMKQRAKDYRKEQYKKRKEWLKKQKK